MKLALVFVLALVAWLLVAEPLLGRHAHRRLMRALDAGVAGARRRFYLQWTWQGWLLVGITALIAFGIAGWTPAQLGLRLPHDHAGIPIGMLIGFCVALLGGALAGAVAARLGVGRKPGARPAVAGGDKLLRMLPQTRTERWAFAALAVTAGLGEEFVWRGFGLASLQLVWPQLPPAVVVALLAIPFGGAHLYQGRSGVLATTVLGAVMAGLYLGSGSVLIPMLLHVLIDLRALLIPVPAAPPLSATGAAEAALPSIDHPTVICGEEPHERDA